MRRTNLLNRFVALTAVVLMMAALCAPALAGEVSATNVLGGLKAPSSGNKLNAEVAKAEQRDVTYYYGDVNVDQQVNTGDATVVLKYSTGFSVAFSELQMILADANHDTYVNTGDAVKILRITLALDELEVYTGEIPEPSTYAVTFVSGMPSDVMIELPDPEQHKAGDACTIPTKEMVCAEYVFNGWKSSSDGLVYQAGAAYTMPAVDVIFTAQWSDSSAPSGFDVTINFTDSVNNVSAGSTVVKVDKTTTFTSTTVTAPDGYKMVGSQSQTVTVNDHGATPSSISFKVYCYKVVDGKEFVMISTKTGIESIRSNFKLNYMLANDIDMASSERFVPIGWQADGSEDVAFEGILDGNGYKISNFYCDWWDAGENIIASNVGLIAINNGTIRNLWIDTSVYETNPKACGVYGGRRVGIIAGSNDQKGLIENCHVYGQVGTSDTSADENGSTAASGGAGGITGTNIGIVVNCSSIVGAEGFLWVGGIVGKNFGTIDKSWFAGSINASVSDEILTGYNLRNMGGIAGGTTGMVTDSYALVLDKIQANNSVGGLFGWVKGGTFKNLYVAVIKGGVGGVEDIDILAGYVVQEPVAQSGLYNLTEGVTALPNGFVASVWDLSGACNPTMPDLVSNRRPADLNW